MNSQVIHYKEVNSEVIAYRNRVDLHTGFPCTSQNTEIFVTNMKEFTVVSPTR